mmetsp:Transcript_1281/g.2279  ORF Transcript_1281/g.2279 Transcript_1281/m.2279 type:complete len:100 (+) Transcript_1281:2-301(+)
MGVLFQLKKSMMEPISMALRLAYCLFCWCYTVAHEQLTITGSTKESATICKRVSHGDAVLTQLYCPLLCLAFQAADICERLREEAQLKEAHLFFWLRLR